MDHNLNLGKLESYWLENTPDTIMVGWKKK